MSKEFKIICFKSLLNIIALSTFIYGNITNNELFIIAGGASMIVFLFILFGKIFNPLIAIILGVILSITLTPWYYGIFWAVGIFSIFQIISFLYNLVSKSDFLKSGFRIN
jgi:hypothetical protein